MSLIDPTQQLLEAAMRGSWQRQTALTNNIANADTPNYQRQEVDFESTLQTRARRRRRPCRKSNSRRTAVPGEAGPNGAGV